MREHQVEAALEHIGGEQFTPSAELIRATKQRVGEGRLLPAAIFLSCVLQIATVIAITVALMTAGISLTGLIYGLVGIIGLTSGFYLLILMVRQEIRQCFMPLEPALECD